MKKVTNTKVLTTKQTQNMAENLREKFGKYSAVGSEYLAYPTRGHMEYTMYVADRCSRAFKTWQNLLSHYHKLMET